MKDEKPVPFDLSHTAMLEGGLPVENLHAALEDFYPWQPGSTEMIPGIGCRVQWPAVNPVFEGEVVGVLLKVLDDAGVTHEVQVLPKL